MASGRMNIDYDNGTVSFTGKCNIGQKLDSYKKNIDAVLDRALFLTGGKLQERSVKLTPVDTGELRSRAFASDIQEDKDGKTIVVGYESKDQQFVAFSMNGETSDNKYAVYVHERTDLHHDVGQAKFLETASKEFDTDFYTAVGKLIKKDGKP